MAARRGFAALSPEARRAVSAAGGKAAHEKGTAHRYAAGEEARVAGKKGGKASVAAKAAKKSAAGGLLLQDAYRHAGVMRRIGREARNGAGLPGGARRG